MIKLLKTVLGVVSFGVAGAAVAHCLCARRVSRRGWERQFRRMAKRGDDRLVELPRSRWDEEQWVWE